MHEDDVVVDSDSRVKLEQLVNRLQNEVVVICCYCSFLCQLMHSLQYFDDSGLAAAREC